MTSTTLKHHIEMLEKATTNDERLQAVLKIRDYCKEEEMSKDSEIGLETFECIGSNFSMLLDPTTVIQGEEAYLVRSTLIDVLFYFVQDERLAVHTKMFAFLPLIGKIITLGNDADNDTCTETVEKCYGILKCIAQHSNGLDAIINSNTVVSVCSAAGAFKVGHKDAERMLMYIAEMRGERMWSDINIGGLNCLFLTYTESIDNDDNDDGNGKWQVLETMNILLSSVDVKYRDQYNSWSRQLQNVILKRLCCKLSRKHRENAFNLAMKLAYIFGVQWVLEADRKLLLQLVRLAAVYVSVGLANNDHKQLGMGECLTCYCDFLCNVLKQCDVLPIEICKIMTATVKDICNMFILEGEREKSNDQNKHGKSNLDRNRCDQNDGNESKLNVKDQQNNETEHDDKDTKTLNQQSLADNTSSDEAGRTVFVPNLMLYFSNILLLWHRSTNQADRDTREARDRILDTQPYLLKIFENVIESYEVLCHESELDIFPVGKESLLNGIIFFITLIVSNMVHDGLGKEKIPKLLGNFILLTWADFKKTDLMYRKPLSFVAAESMHNLGMNRLTVSRLFAIQNEAITLAVKTTVKAVLTQTERYVTTDEMKCRLYKFAIINLPYLEANVDLVRMAYGVMAMGLTLSRLLTETNKLPAEDTSLFFKTSVSLLKNHYAVQKRGKITKIMLNPRLAGLCLTDIWTRSIKELSDCIPIIPSVMDCILQLEWITDILQKLQDVEAKYLEQETRDSFGCILTACAKHSAQCKKIILKNNGLHIAKKLGLSVLGEELYS